MRASLTTRVNLTLFMCSLIAPLWAQLTPAEYREQVSAYSLELKSAEVTIERSEASAAYERVSRLPNLSAAGRFAYNFQRVGGERDWGSFVEPQIVQTIYGGGAIRAKIESADLTTRIARREAEFTKLEIEYAADYAYWNLWAMARYHAAMSQYVDLIRREMAVIERRFEEGYVAKGDLLMIASRQSEAEYELISAAKSRTVAQNNLNTLRGTSMSDSVKLIRFTAETTPSPRRVSLEMVIDSRPDYASALLAEQVAEASTRTVQGAYNPQLSGGVTGSWRAMNPNLSGSSNNLNGTLYVALSLPIYHFGERRKAIAISRKGEQLSQINTSMVLDTITQEEGNAWVNLADSYAQMLTASRSLNIASENLEISTYAYNEGEVSIVELMQAQISWIQIYTNAINSEYNYQVALSYYRRTVGGDYGESK